MLSTVRRWPVTPDRLLIFITAAGVLWRFVTLGRQSLWLDESYSVWLAAQHASDTIWHGRIDPLHPPGYYAALHYVLAATGTNEFAARLLSAVCSCGSLVMAWWLGARAGSDARTGRVAAALLALSPLDVWYAQEARMYSMVGAAACCTAVGLIASHWWAVPTLIVGLVVGFAADHTMWPLAAALLGIWTVHWWNDGRSRGRLFARTGAVAAAAMLSAPRWAEAMVVYERLNNVAAFRNLRSVTGVDDLTVLPLPLALGAVGVAAAAGALWYRRVTRHAIVVRWAAPLAAFVFAVVTAVAVIPRLFGVKQILACAWPLLVVWLSCVLRAAAREGPPVPNRRGVGRPMWVALGAGALGLGVSLFFPRADWRGASAWISERPGAVAVVDPAWNDMVYRYYRPDDLLVTGPVDSVERLSATGAGIREACLIAERLGRTPPTSPSETWLDGSLRLTGSKRLSRLEVRCYAMPTR